MKEYKVIVAHAGQQSSFRRAEALKCSSMLLKYITTVYVKKKDIKYLSIIKRIKKDEHDRLLLRNSSLLDDIDVKQFDIISNLLLVFINRWDISKKVYTKYNFMVSKRFAKKVAEYAIKNNADALIMMGASPAAAFEKLETKNSKIIKIFDMTSIAYNYQSMIMKREKEKMPKEWQKYISLSTNSEEIDMLMKNIFFADYIICTSNFAYSSLIENGISAEKISVVNYGIEMPIINTNRPKKTEKEKLNLLYVGSVSCEKGVYFLLEAVKRINSKNIALTLVGKKYISDDLLSVYGEWCTFVGDIPHSQLDKYYKEADVFILPTLFDSFGRVISEALSYGVPVITTSSAGAADYIENGKNGFVIPPGDINAIEDRINFFNENKEFLNNMRTNCLVTAKNNSWNTYEKRYSDVIKRIIEKGKSNNG